MPETPATDTPFPLGRIVEHDPRSLNFPAEVAAKVSSKSWLHHGPVLNQGPLGSCTGNAMAQCLNTTPFYVSRLYNQTDAVKLYSRATVLDGFPGSYPPTDTGSSGLAVAKAALEYKWIKSYKHAFGLDMVLGALMLSPMIVGTNWYDGMFRPNSSGFVSISGGKAGGHEYLLTGVNIASKTVTFLNSWGNGWGLGGVFHMTYDTFATLLSQQGDATVSVPVASVPDTPPVFPGTLRVGSKGSAVSAVQRVVGVTADGQFGPVTELAVQRWQYAHGLSGDGVVGPLTWAKMFP